MSIGEFLSSVSIILAAMALAVLIEVAVPLVRRSPRHQGRTRANLGLTAVTLLFNWALTSLAALLALGLALDGWAPMSGIGLPFAVQLVIGIVVLDCFFGYLAHRALHMSSALWRVHRVHHSDRFVDVTTTYRTHPIEVAWRFVFMIVPVWLLGIPAGAVVVYRLVSAINGTLEHANIRLWAPLDRALSLVLVTPNAHKVHHSRAQHETDSNFGNIFSIYDRVLRTFTPTDRGLAVVYGLDDIDLRGGQSLAILLSMPFRDGAPAPPVRAGRLEPVTSGLTTALDTQPR